jgi:predicted metal-binding membrane protein
MWPAIGVRRPFGLFIGGLIVLAWVTLAIWGQSPYGRYLSHHSLEQVRGDGLLMLVFVAGWLVMLMAMMLPTTLPLVAMFGTITRARPDGSRLVGLLLVGYLSIWVIFGMLIYLGDSMLHLALDRSAWLAEHAWALGGVTLLLAGAYQFTPLKYHCLEKCRSPFSFITQHWRGRDEQGQAFLLGIHHGLFCVGCCWTLMLVMFAVGVGNFGWMLVLGSVMSIEKNVTWGRRLSAPLGVVLLAWGLGLLLGVLPTSLVGLGGN